MEIKIAKIGVSNEADQSLDSMLNKINEGFTGGRVTKNDLASWIIRYFESHTLDNCMDKIRKDHFDQVAHLESVIKTLKEARRNNTTVPDLNTLLSPVTSQIKLISAQKKLRSASEAPEQADK